MEARVGVSSGHFGRLERSDLRGLHLHTLPAIAQHYDIPYEHLTALGTWTPLERQAITPKK